MRPRVFVGNFLIRLARFVESLAPAVMRPDDLIAFTKNRYCRPGDIEAWSKEEAIAGGLTPMEQELLQQVPIKQGRLLLLGMGGGRDAVALARTGYEVVGVDYVAGMVAKAIENAAQQGLKIEGLVQEFSCLDVPRHSFGLVVFSPAMYSMIPTRKRRVEMLRKIGRSLKPDGFCLCQFLYDTGVSRRCHWLRKGFAFLTLGNFGNEIGDQIMGGGEFVHYFSSPSDLTSEFAEGGFTVLYATAFPNFGHAGVVLQRESQ